MTSKLTTKSSLFTGGVRNQHMESAAATAMWNSLNLAIDQIFTQKTSSLSFNELYNYGYQLVIHKHGDLLYKGVQTSVQTHLNALLQIVQNTPPEGLLTIIKQTWEEYKTTSNNLKDILMYLDRTWVGQNKKTPISTLMVQIFRDVIILNADISGRLRSLLLENVQQERQGMLIDRDLMKAVLSMLADLGPDGQDVYESFFEAPFLTATRAYFKLLSQEYLAQNTCPDFMRMAELRLSEEADRVTHYLSSSSDQKLKHVCEVELIQTHARTLVELESSGCQVMIHHDKIDDLKRMYSLFYRLPATLDILREFMSSYVKTCGLKIVADQEVNKDSIQFVQQMLDLKAKLDTIIAQAFRGEKRAQKKLKEAFEEFVNQDVRCASHLASYIDDLLKAGLKDATEEAADEKLDRVIVIFRYLSDKDIFESFYKNHLSKRLLHAKSVSDELEKHMISKLKVECGYQFTSKLESMFQDMKQSKAFQEEFRRHEAYAQCPIELEVLLLSQGNWPITSKPPANRLPPIIVRCCDIFTTYYMTRHDGRKLTWCTQMGNADVKATFPHGRHELSVSTYQMCILLAFNDAQTLTYHAIMQICGVDDDKDLLQHIMGLCSKLKLLNREGQSKYAAADDVFSVNAEFRSKFKRIKVPLVAIKDVDNGEATAGGLPTQVEEERKHICEAAIVRIMKTRKVLPHNELIAEVTRQLASRFAAQPPFIKKRIESLIERDYVARDRDDARIYNYFA